MTRIFTIVLNLKQLYFKISFELDKEVTNNDQESSEVTTPWHNVWCRSLYV